MIVMSFPPLFGHEIVAVLVGLVWGAGVGFGIVAAGTLFGEIIAFLYVFLSTSLCILDLHRQLQRVQIHVLCKKREIRKQKYPVCFS